MLTGKGVTVYHFLYVRSFSRNSFPCKHLSDPHFMHFSAKISRNLFLYKDLTFISKMSISMNFSRFRFLYTAKLSSGV